jgi:hypothetical protein
MLCAKPVPCTENFLMRRGRFRGRFVPQGFEALDELGRQPFRLQALQEVRAEVRARRAPLQHVCALHVILAAPSAEISSYFATPGIC